jgi:phosphopantetheinyl transferase (holo-ACP synthase)
MFDKMCSSEETFQDLTGKIKTYGQRISFASKRVAMLQGQFARKEAILKVQLSDGMKATEQGEVRSRIEEPEKDR